MTKAFEFRLEKLLELRRLREDVAQRELGEARKAVAEQNRVILAILNEEEAGKKALRELMKKTVNILQLRLQEGYLASLERRLRQEYGRLQELSKTEQEKRKALIEARKGVRVLERFRERQYREYRHELEAEERKFLDEVAQNAATGDRGLSA
jgi:flagellar FliJ protein